MGPPLRTHRRFLAYRRGPMAMYALSAYIGGARLDRAVRRVLQKRRCCAPRVLTSLDLFRELQAATPDALQGLLHDLFAADTFWEFETRRARAERDAAGLWRVTLDVRARKVVLDEAGLEREVPMADPVEVGVFAAGAGGALDQPLHLALHPVRSGEQSIAVTVPRAPALAGVDPHHLLVDWDVDCNVRQVELAG